MAGDWLKVEKATPRKLEVLRIATLLDVHPDHAFGLCFRFWSWCDDNLVTGNAAGVTKIEVDKVLDRPGFADALITVGWLVVRNSSLEVPNFDRHLSQGAKQRALTAARVAEHKKKTAPKSNGSSVTKALPREEKRREEIITHPPSESNFAFPKNWSQRCQSQWEKWQSLLKSQGIHMRAIQWEAQSMQHAHLSEPEWYEALLLTVSKNAKSICVEDFSKRKQQASKPKAPERVELK